MSSFKLRHAQKVIDKSNIRFKLKNIDRQSIPLVSHFNKDTIITKNGHLIKTIKFKPYNFKTLGSDITNFQIDLKDALKKSVKKDDVTIYVHNLRKKKNITNDYNYKNNIFDSLNQEWLEYNKWNDSNISEIYISIVIYEFQSQYLEKFNISYKLYNNIKKKVLNILNKRLNRIISILTKELDYYHPHILTIKEYNDNIYSELINFFYEIFFLDNYNMKLNKNDISHILSNGKISANDGLIHIKSNYSNRSKYAYILSLKEYSQFDINILDKILNKLGHNIIISQMIQFVDNAELLSKIDYQQYILDISQDNDFKSISGINEIIKDSNNSSDHDYIKYQVNIVIYDDNIENLNIHFKEIITCLHDMVINFVKEDIFAISSFFSILPDNIIFNKRQVSGLSKNICDFASLNNIPIGNINSDNSDYISILPSFIDSPYFFNLDKDNSNIFIFGKNEYKNIFINFILFQSLHFDSKIIYFDSNNSSELFINAINGKYYKLSNKSNQLSLNIFSLVENYSNKDFFIELLITMANYGNLKITKEDLRKFDIIIDNIFKNKIKDSQKLILLLKENNLHHISQKLSIFFKNGKYDFIFDNEKESFNLSDKINGFYLSKILNIKELSFPIVKYLLYKIKVNKNKEEKLILVLDNFFLLMNDNKFINNLRDFLKDMKDNNIYIIAMTDNSNNLSANININELFSNILLFPVQYFNSKNIAKLKLSEYDFNILKFITNNPEFYYLKSESYSIVLKYVFASFSKLSYIFGNNEEILSIMNKIKSEIEKNSGNISDLLPMLIKYMDKKRKEVKEVKEGKIENKKLNNIYSTN